MRGVCMFSTYGMRVYFISFCDDAIFTSMVEDRHTHMSLLSSNIIYVVAGLKKKSTLSLLGVSVGKY